MPELPELEMEFDDLEHRYSLGGVTVPGLTSVLQHTGIAPGFWFLSREDQEFYSSRGQAVHKCVELSVRKTLDRRTIVQEVRPYLIGIERFFADHKVEVLEYEGGPFAERPLIHKTFRYGCRPDLVVRIGDRTGVCEVKATSAHSPATAIQTAGQLLAVRHVMPRVGVMRVGLRLLKTEPWYDLKWYDERSDEAVWLSALNLYNFQVKHKLLRQNGGR